MRKNNFNEGQILVQVLIIGSIAVYLVTAIANWAASNIRISTYYYEREKAIQIAEAGTDYYRWHLAHAPTDFKDGTSAAGPYNHDFVDKSGNIIGRFSLSLTAPMIGSTLVTVNSTGTVVSNPAVFRAIQTQLAKPSVAKYAIVSNSNVRFGFGTEVFGPIHSNGGIRFDGIAHNIISSSIDSYNDPDHEGNKEFGVHTHVNPPPGTGVNDSFRSAEAPPSVVQPRADVFLAGRQFPVPAVDFSGITSDVSTMKSDAQTAGFYKPASGDFGYHVVLKVDDTFDLYNVTALADSPNGCPNSEKNWGTWSIETEDLIGNYPLPANGIMFFEDNVFVDGKINGARVTIIAARLPDVPSKRKSIIVNNDLLYTNYDGTDSIGLISQGDFNIGLMSSYNLRIDAALFSQYGRVGRHYYAGSENKCGTYGTKGTLTLYGMIASNERYGFAYTDGTGYQIRNLIYDGSFLYGPPPSFPLTSDQYVNLTWQEVR
jgi:hypothetical protein